MFFKQYVCGYVHMVSVEASQLDSSADEIIGACEAPQVGAGNEPWVLWTSTYYSLLITEPAL